MTSDQANVLILALLAGYLCVGPCLLVAFYVIGDAWRAWRWKRGAPARAAELAESDRKRQAQIDQWNAEALARGDDEKIILAGGDCIVITYRGNAVVESSERSPK